MTRGTSWLHDRAHPAPLLCLLPMIGFATWRMAAVTHRFVNIGLTMALLVGIVFSFFVATHLFELSGQHGAYGQMVSEDYDSVSDAAQLSTMEQQPTPTSRAG